MTPQPLRPVSVHTPHAVAFAGYPEMCPVREQRDRLYAAWKACGWDWPTGANPCCDTAGAVWDLLCDTAVLAAQGLDVPAGLTIVGEVRPDGTVAGGVVARHRSTSLGHLRSLPTALLMASRWR